MASRINKPDTNADLELRQCLNKKQSFVMVAGAGSGKTTSLIKSLQYIKTEFGKQLIAKRQKVACITYTTGAEKEIISDIGDDEMFHVSTIHSFLWELIRPFQTDIKIWVEKKIEEKLLELKIAPESWTNRTRPTTKQKHALDLEKSLKSKQNIAAVQVFNYGTGSDYERGILGHNDIIKMVPELIELKPLLRKIIVKKFPFFFVDESQDTLPIVVNALLTLNNESPHDFCLGFFGDAMQKIYTQGIGEIPIDKEWVKIIKPENFRCPTEVLDVINNIRRPGDGLEQTGGRRFLKDGVTEFVKGTARIFIFPTDEKRESYIDKARQFVADNNNDKLWLSDEKDANLKVLVIEHRMAAKRLGFDELYSIFKDGTSDSIGSSFTEGKHWALQPFLKFIIPLVKAFENEEDLEIMDLLRFFCPLVQKEHLSKNKPQAGKLLLELKEQISILYTLMKSDGVTIKEILQYVDNKQLVTLDERLRSSLHSEISLTDDGEEDEEILKVVMEKYFSCSTKQLWGYQKYINEESPFSTQHSIKGAEFERVIVILDDEEGAKTKTISYEKLLGLKDPSPTDLENIEGGLDSVFGRTRRLLYVCCSRALQDLVVLLFINDVENAFENVKKSQFFSDDQIFTLSRMK
ncbi:UvrD-helicase domain-containing protein [Mucilaginibacter pedocola]|uniref:DNA 3'-5' helicase II n=1 Tax=Mucilaginibacter pedocola TaxID=1792845 RepID=A0A1S9P8U4_9SPHI|nr:UvrD-helicase domain-containing protein [Mucilaginibacter pedocola]OOQ57390.1 hypothetical protein BC343_14920 [Mucilaginibacter pedocola]